jgi:hypothetical protein
VHIPRAHRHNFHIGEADPVRLIGLSLVGREVEGGVEGDLFDAEALEPHLRDRRHSKMLDAIRRNFGKGALQRGLSRRR